MPSTTDANGNITLTGDRQTLTVPAGGRTITVQATNSSVTGGTGPNTYNVTGAGNTITVGTGPATVNSSGISTRVNPGVAELSATLTGNSSSVVGGAGRLFVRASGTGVLIAPASSNVSSNTFITTGNGARVNNTGGNDTVAIVGDTSLFASGVSSAGTDTFVLRAGTPTDLGPEIQRFQPGTDKLAILVDTLSNSGLADLGLAPMNFLTDAQFSRSSTPPTPATRFIYDPATGRLRFTPQGSASTANYGVARLPLNLNLQANQLFISNQFVYGAPTQTILDVSPARSGYTTAVNPEGNGGPVTRFAVTDSTNGLASSAEPGQVLSSDPNGLAAQFVYNGADVLAVASQTADNVFIKSNSSAKVSALAGGGGNDVLDGGLGSVFLTGGTGRDFFFTDARQSQFVWSTVTDFSAREIVTLWGFQQGRDSFTILPREGGAGYEGVTLEATINGANPAIARVTLSGRTQADFVISYGEAGDGKYLAINSVQA